MRQFVGIAAVLFGSLVLLVYATIAIRIVRVYLVGRWKFRWWAAKHAVKRAAKRRMHAKMHGVEPFGFRDSHRRTHQPWERKRH
jgi:hypothetical protein